jgi:hypothetical protein
VSRENWARHVRISKKGSFFHLEGRRRGRPRSAHSRSHESHGRYPPLLHRRSPPYKTPQTHPNHPPRQHPFPTPPHPCRCRPSPSAPPLPPAASRRRRRPAPPTSPPADAPSCGLPTPAAGGPAPSGPRPPSTRRSRSAPTPHLPPVSQIVQCARLLSPLRVISQGLVHADFLVPTSLVTLSPHQ